MMTVVKAPLLNICRFPMALVDWWMDGYVDGWMDGLVAKPRQHRLFED